MTKRTLKRLYTESEIDCSNNRKRYEEKGEELYEKVKENYFLKFLLLEKVDVMKLKELGLHRYNALHRSKGHYISLEMYDKIMNAFSGICDDYYGYVVRRLYE